MASYDWSALEYLASKVGMTGQQLYDTAGSKAFADLAAEYAPRGLSVIKDQSGRTIALVNQTTGEWIKNPTIGTDVAQNVSVSGNNLVTTVQKTAGESAGTSLVKYSSGANELATTAAGRGGVTLGAVTMQDAIMSGMAVLGGVAAGVDMYNNNPEFWENLSRALLPFAYGGSYAESGDYLADAMASLIPVAVGADGKTYLPNDFIETLAQCMISAGVFNPGEGQSESGDYYGWDDAPTVNYIEGTACSLTREGYVFDFVSNVPMTMYAIPYLRGVTIVFSSQVRATIIRYIDGREAGYYSTSFAMTHDGKAVYRSEYDDVNPGVLTNVPINIISGRFDRSRVSWLTVYGDNSHSGSIDNVSPYPGGVYPQDGVPISQTYPEWWAQRLQTVDPNSNPDNIAYKDWVPVSINNDPTNKPTSTTGDQPTGQTGDNPYSDVEPTAMTPAQEKILDAIKDLIETLTKTNPDTGTPTDPPSDTGDTGSPTPPVVTGSSNGLWAIYNPSNSQLQSFGRWLWSDDIVTQIAQWINNPMTAIIGLHAIYCTPSTGGSQSIKVGYLDSGVSAPVVTNQYATIDCGSVTIPEVYQNALDYDYTTVHIYLPFVGIVPLDTRDIMGGTIHVIYRIDVLTGTCLAQLEVSRQNSNAVLYAFSGNCAVQIPLTSGNYGQLLTGLLSAVGGVVAAAATGGAALPAVAGVGSAVINSHANTQRSGNMGSNAGALGIRKPYLIIKRPIAYDATQYNNYYGFPANKTVMVGNLSGYTRFKQIHVENVTATNDEKTMIESYMKTGVII